MKINTIAVFFLFIASLQAQLFLPENDFAPGWEKSDAALVFNANDLYGHINGGAELFLEFGFKQLTVQRYARAGQEITLELYEMENATAALGIYLMKCGRENPVLEISARNTVNAYQFTIVKGPYFILINNFSGEETIRPVQMALSQYILPKIPERETITLMDMLPSEGRIAHSERIFRGPYGLQPIYTFGEGDVFQLDSSVFGVAADYPDSSGQIFTRLYISYPNETDAAAALKNVRRHLDSYLVIQSESDDHIIFKDYRQRFGKICRKEKAIQIEVGLLKME